MENKKFLSAELCSALLSTLKDRFEKNTNRHKGVLNGLKYKQN